MAGTQNLRGERTDLEGLAAAAKKEERPAHDVYGTPWLFSPACRVSDNS